MLFQLSVLILLLKNTSDFLEMFYFGLYSGIDWKTADKMTDKQSYNFYVCYMENLLQPKLTGAITVESPAWLQKYKNNVENMAVSKNVMVILIFSSIQDINGKQ